MDKLLFASGTEEAAAEVATALRSNDPYVYVLARWTESALACDLAEAQNDASTYIYEQEKIVVYRRYLAAWSD
jgi:HEAT repeat protein